MLIVAGVNLAPENRRPGRLGKILFVGCQTLQNIVQRRLLARNGFHSSCSANTSALASLCPMVLTTTRKLTHSVLRRHFATSGALKASHQRINVGMSAIGLSLVTFFGIKTNIVVHACCGHFPLCSTFSRNSTISPLVSFVTF